MHYLVPALQRAKRREHLQALERVPVRGDVLKTDLYEEAYGEDALLDVLLARGGSVTGIDIDPGTVEMAERRFPEVSTREADIRSLPFDDGAFDTVVSTSTLDNLDGGFEQGIAEIARVTADGGHVFMTLDNPHNMPYWLLRRIDRAAGYHDFRLGRSARLPETATIFAEAGLRPVAHMPVMRYPPGLNTLLRPVDMVSGRAAERVVRSARLDSDRIGSGWFYGIVARRDRNVEQCRNAGGEP